VDLSGYDPLLGLNAEGAQPLDQIEALARPGITRARLFS